MKALFVFVLTIFILYVDAQQPIDSYQREIVFRSVNVIPMDRERVLTNQVVVVKDGRIKTIGARGKIKFNNDALVIDARGKYLIPGLTEMHAHVPPGNELEPMKEVLLLFAAHGVTTIRGMLGHPKHLELRSMINGGKTPGPRFYTSGPAISGSSVKSTADAERMVREQKTSGYDFLKLLPGLTRENFDAVRKVANEVRIPFAGHVSFDVGVWHAIESDYATIDHLDGFIEGIIPGIESMTENESGLFGMYAAELADTTRIPALMKALREHNVWVVPTQALAERWFTPVRSAESFRNDPEMIYMDKKTLDNWVNAKNRLSENPRFDSIKMDAYNKLRRKLIFECNRSGVGLLLGSDAPQIFNVPGVSTHHELQYLVDAGLTPYEALYTGTVNPARFYKRDDMGVIKKGAVSDLILLNANPLEDISNTTKIEGVMLGNSWWSSSFISKTLQQLEKE